ncbi:HlyD family efflux transporter periplasmic adaptor subunit [Pseudahrensia aquimaris]|uniref:HlyD family efflux transporter periplasmic adaptor subunit n=1 Tax=Pseudahrensia aquimaris TaxID=744461 RepID=A0ABW3FGL6_9HYPH
MLSQQEGNEPVPLPVLRDDLEIVKTAPLANGAPAWVIFDPVAGRYFEIGRELLDMLMVWRVGEAKKLIRTIRTEFGRVVSEEDIAEAVHFLISNALVRDIPNNDYKLMAQTVQNQKKSWFSTMMHSYLFFRIPLVRPDKFLRRTWPAVSPLFTRTAVWIYAIIGLIGLYLVSRQWDQFAGTFQFLLSWQGALLYGASLVVVKSLHELGHAYMAVRYGLRVPTIGVAFMVLMPVLYTDTSGAWRLKSRRERLMIDGAGIFTELTLACLATFIWVFLPEGGLRLCFFAIATTSWITSLFVNLNPLMRFDGYYILSDALGFQNMQNRGFEMARWRLREILFGLGEPAPELLTRKMRRTVIIHAWATWIYRFFLFLGIAILVYAFFIKIIGILLFAVEIIWFILMPVGREMRHWWSIRDKIMKTKRFLVTSLVLAGAVAVAVIPWSTRIVVPSVMTAEHEQTLFPPFAGQVVDLKLVDGMKVEEGDVLAVLASPEIDQKLKQAQERARLLESRIDRTGADSRDRASLVVLENELNEVREEMDGLNRVREQLTMRAPFAGVVTDMDPELHVGIWTNVKTPMATIQDRERLKVKGYVSEQNLFRFAEGARATFIPDNPELAKTPLQVASVSVASVERLDEPYLAMRYGGDIAVDESDKKALRPTAANYAIDMVPSADEAILPASAVRGISVIQGEAESFYTRIKRQVLKVFVREMGV